MIHYNDGTTAFWMHADAIAYCLAHGIPLAQIAYVRTPPGYLALVVREDEG